MDLAVLHWIQDVIQHPALIGLFKLITFTGDGGYLWIALALILFLKGERKKALFLLLTLGLTSLVVNQGIKLIVLRDRPFVTDPTLIPRITPPTSTSFPSGHSSTSMCCAFYLLLTEKNWFGRVSFVWGILICLSRLVLLVHYPTDVLCGALIGIMIGYLMFKAKDKFQLKKTVYEKLHL